MSLLSLIKSKERFLLILLTGLAACELVSQFSFTMLNLPGIAYPWEFLTLLIQGNMFSVSFSAVTVGLGYTAYLTWVPGGTERLISILIITVLTNFLIGTAIGLVVFARYYHILMTSNPLLFYKIWLLLPNNAKHPFIISVIAGNSILPVITAIAFLVRLYRSDDVLGSAHFANLLEIVEMHLWGKEGIILGYKFGKPLRMPGFEGVLGIAPTGGGKTTAVAVPNLLTWSGSVVANDLKGELYQLTAEHRCTKLGNTCYNFAPAREDLITDRYNPFYYVSHDKNLHIRDLQLISEILIPAERIDGGFWYTSSREVFIMLALYLIEKNGTTTLAEIHDLSKINSFMEWLAFTVEEHGIECNVFYQNAYSLLNSDEKTYKNILKDFHSRMTLFSDPIVRNATEGNTFDFSLLRKERMSIYINLPDADKERLKPLLTLFWAQLINTMTQAIPDESEPYPVLALLDEFGNMGKINKLKEGMSFLRAYHVRPIILVQHLAQILSVYGQHDAKSFLNAKVKLIFTLNDLEDAQFVSNCMGSRTIKVVSHGTNQGQHSSSSQNTSLQSRPLMTPDQIMQLNKNMVLILIEGLYPIQAAKYYWFKHKKAVLLQL